MEKTSACMILALVFLVGLLAGCIKTEQPSINQNPIQLPAGNQPPLEPPAFPTDGQTGTNDGEQQNEPSPTRPPSFPE